jgi:D-cysteine desulfhydrase family pyridoxal phosphate-dependent enzyme
MPLAALPTPLYEATRFREALGGPARCPRIVIKRDDLTALGLGGNKARKLEYLVAEARAQGATTLITTGALQSNHARMTAAAACAVGMRCVLVLTTTKDNPELSGNLLLDRLYGATIRLVPSVDPMIAVGNDEPVVAEAVEEEARAGRKPYVIPIGGSSAAGAFGYVSGTTELLDQLAAAAIVPSRLYYASGSRGTQAGLTLGAKLCRAEYQVMGIAVSGGEPEKTERAKRIANEAATRLGLPERLEHADLVTDQNFIGEGYGIPTAAGLDAIGMLARTEGILLDPCYTAKAMAALVQHARGGELAASDTVVFLHTGGVPAIFTTDFAAVAPVSHR